MALELSPRGQKNLEGQEVGAGKASAGRGCGGVTATALPGVLSRGAWRGAFPMTVIVAATYWAPAQ